MSGTRRPSVGSELLLLLRRSTARHWRHAPGSTLVLILILALGIAVYLAVRLANRAATAGFQDFTALVAGESDWVLTPYSGTLADSVPGEIRAALDDLPVHVIPVVESTAVRPGGPEDAIGSRPTLQLLGLDLVAVGNLAGDGTDSRGWFATPDGPGSAGDGGDFWKTLTHPRSVFISREQGLLEGIGPGDRLPLIVNESVVELEVAGWIPSPPDRPTPPADLLVMDLPAAQRLTARPGRVDRIEIRIEAGPGAAGRREAVREILAGCSNGRWEIRSPGDRKAAAATMTRAFRFNLTLLSLLALIVGLYLVFQALDGAVVRRRQEIATLRSLGVGERTIRAAWLVESGLLGLAGGVVGVVLGWLGAQVAVRLVSRTVNALYHATHVRQAAPLPGEIVAALALAVGAGWVAGWGPARRAAATPPAQILARSPAPAGRERRPGRQARIGLLLLTAAATVALLPPVPLSEGGRFPLGGYLAAGLVVAGAGMAGAGLLAGLARGAAPLAGRDARWRLALSHTAVPSGRHRLAVAALVCAVGMTAGMSVLVSSFDHTMRGWIGRTFQADLYLSSDGAQSASTQNRIRPETWREVLAHPGVAEANVIHVADIRLDAGRTMLVGSDLGFARRHMGFAWRGGAPDAAVFDPDRNGGLALVSESFAGRFRVSRGDTLRVPTPVGPRALRVAGVFADYGNERGSIVVDRRGFVAWFEDELASSLILELRPGVDAADVRDALRNRFPGLAVLTQSRLRSEVLRIFRQTFALTHALELIGVGVSVIGLGLTLVSVLLDRRPELQTLRALGFRGRDVAMSTAIEGCLIATTGTLLGLAASLGLGLILIRVINRQAFGWTLDLAVPPAMLGMLALAVILTGTGVAWGVGHRSANLPADREPE